MRGKRYPPWDPKARLQVHFSTACAEFLPSDDGTCCRCGLPASEHEPDDGGESGG